ncbi:unnamed protein product [Adineta ricciae]|uniref:Peptidase M14 domain-containing protein n=2 Tax=Adineta ricciae TaxID=249248 RepID=A0A815PCG7_ADIRI|nr:unnamed protein product [Adineta ricciae]
MADSNEKRTVKLPQIHPVSNQNFELERFQQLKTDTDSYEQWRANIHRQLEEDLQRQVQALLAESEKQELLNKQRQQQLRTGQRLPFQQPEVDIPQGVPWSEIDRRNRSVLCSQNGKDPSETKDNLSSLNYQRSTQPNHTFDFDSYGNYRRCRRYSLENIDYALDNSSFHFQTLGDYKRRSINSITTDLSSTVLLHGNSIVKSNKADILNLLDQRSSTNINPKTFVNQYGVVISEDGPFWPCDYRILHPTPKLNTREVTPKEEFYSSVDESSLKNFNFTNPSSSLIFSRTPNALVKFYSDTELTPNDSQQELDSLINSSKRLFSNINFRSRLYKKQQFILSDGTIKTTYCFRSTEIPVDDHGPFWPMAVPIKHPGPSFSFLIRNEDKQEPKECYSLGTKGHQTFDNQPAGQKYTDPFKHAVVVYEIDKTPRKQEAKPLDNETMCPTLIFESRFEGGNLQQAKRVGQFEYELVLQPDLYTRRHIQWYYFRVQNMIANITYRFRIINLMKKSSLYNEGMKILLFSELAKKRESQGWHRVGHHINYSEYKPRSYNSLLDRDINYFELDFQLEFFYTGDTCYISHCYPYTFTDLKDDLDYLSSTRPREIFRRDVLCESQAGNSCFIVTVTDESVPVKQKKFVLITARIHPGETNSSYMMRGLLEFITSDDEIAKRLRSQLVFKIVPMLNPDGVIVGNYRCSLTGKDMNRNFRHPHKQSFPTIYHIKQLVQTLQKERREILAFCDLHGHSRKSNVFAYGCDGCDGPQPDMKNFLSARVLPFIMSKIAPEMFAFDDCKFHIHRCKESTGRVVMWREMLIKNSFTLEASFGGSSIVDKPSHFNIQDYEKFGQCICESLRQYLDILSDSARMDTIFMDITKCVLQKLEKEKIPPALLSLIYPVEKQEGESIVSMTSVSDCLQALKQCHRTIYEQDASSSSDSDSDPEGGELPEVSYRKGRGSDDAAANGTDIERMRTRRVDDETSGVAPKKQSRKKRTEKAIEERVQKLARKREIQQSQPLKTTFVSTHEDIDGTSYEPLRRNRISYPSMASETETCSQIKLTLSVDQMDKATRALPPRGTLFVSKYANRSGHGQPIFSTERALERKQKKLNAVLQEFQTNEYDADTEQNVYSIPEHSQLEISSIADQNTSLTHGIGKRTTSLASLTLNDFLPSLPDQPISTISGTYVSQPTISKNLPVRRLRTERRPQLSNRTISSNDISQLSHVLEITTPITPQLNLSSSINAIDTSVTDSSNRYSYETQMDSNGINHYRLQAVLDNVHSSLPKSDAPVIRSNANAGVKMPSVFNSVTQHKRVSKPRSYVYSTQQLLAPIEPTARELSASILHENTHQLNPMERFSQIVQQLHVPAEKSKRV